MARIDIKKMILYPYRVAVNALQSAFGEDDTPVLAMRGKHCTDGGTLGDSADGEVTIFYPYRDDDDEGKLKLRGQMNQKECPEDTTTREDWGKSIGVPFRESGGEELRGRAPTWCEPCPETVNSPPSECYGGFTGDQEDCALSDKATKPPNLIVPEYLDVTLSSFSDCCNDDDPGTSDDGHTGAFHDQIRGTVIICSPCGGTPCTSGACTAQASVPCWPDLSDPACTTEPGQADYALVARYIGCASDVGFPETCDSDGDLHCHRYAAGGCPDCESGDTDCICVSDQCDPGVWDGTECVPGPHIAPLVDVEICISLYCYSGTLKVRSALVMVIDLQFVVPPSYTHQEACVKQYYVGCFEITRTEETCLDIDDSYVLSAQATCGAVEIGEDQHAGVAHEWTVTLGIAAREAA